MEFINSLPQANILGYKKETYPYYHPNSHPESTNDHPESNRNPSWQEEILMQLNSQNVSED